MKKKKQVTFQEAYPAPYCNLTDSYMWTADKTIALQFLFYNPKIAKQITDMLNGNGKRSTHEVTYDNRDGKIYFDEKPLMLVRGWGHLTGEGGLKLKPVIAAKIQDEFAEWVCQTLAKLPEKSETRIIQGTGIYIENMQGSIIIK